MKIITKLNSEIFKSFEMSTQTCKVGVNLKELCYFLDKYAGL